MPSYTVYFQQTFIAKGWRTIKAENEEEAGRTIAQDLVDNPATEEISDDGEVEITEVKEI
jgi:hypothetical protein